MDTNWLIDIPCELRDQVWVDKVNDAYVTGKLCLWVSSFHPDKLPCALEGTWHNGSFNGSLKMVFSDGTAWMLRFPRAGIIHGDYIDEKVIMEVRAYAIIRANTTVPLPQIWAWGVTTDNPLGLGPFMIIEFIEGVSLNHILNDDRLENPPSMIKDSMEDKDIRFIYRQFANILLQIFKLDFRQIGSLEPPTDLGRTNFAPMRPLTFKTHGILQGGGVDTFGDRNIGFATSSEYFQYLIGQDLEQLDRQPNSVTGRHGAMAELTAFRALRSVIPDLVHPEYDHRKFKFICDDLGLGNIIVKSKDDLTIVGVVDLEWSYIGPAQLAASAPWWLLRDRPVNPAWDCDPDEPVPMVASRYFKYLEIFLDVLEDEEARLPGYESKEYSKLVRWSQTSGAMWLHMLLVAGSINRRSFPFFMLQKCLGDKWGQKLKEFENADGLDDFGYRKERELQNYDEMLVKMEEDKMLVDSGKMSKECFLATYIISYQ